jgi:MFS family permease
MQTTAQQWLVYKLTGSVVLLGLLTFANQIPMLFLASVGGYVGDRYNRHQGVVVTQILSMVLAFVLAALTLTHRINKWDLIVIAFLVGIVNAFDVPIRQSFFVHMVGKEDLSNAIALNSSIFNGARIVGPALAGFAIAWVGEGWCFFLNGMSFLAVIVALLLMRLERTPIKKSGESPLQGFLQGFRFAMRDVPVRSSLLLLSVLSFFGLQTAVFLPIYAREILHGEARTLGLLMSAAGVGAFLGALHFAARTEYSGLARWIASTCTTVGIGMVIFSQARTFWLCAVILFFVGYAGTSQMAATNTLIQSRVPDELRSRVMAVYATMFMGVQPIGALLAGVVAKKIGAADTLAIFGGMVLVAALFFIFLVVAPMNKREAEATV